MPTDHTTPSTEPSPADAPDTRRRAPLPRDAVLSLSFRSRAATPLSEDALRAFVDAVRERNRAHGITGLLLYDRGRFVQWLEGPPDDVRAAWTAIQCDPQHVAAELLGECTTPTRLFGGSDLHLILRVADASGANDDGDLDRIVTDLAAFAMAGASAAVDALIEDRLRAGQDMRSLRCDLIEPAARRLGDWRDVGRCCDIEATLAAAYLQRSARRLGAAVPLPEPLGGSARTVLIAAHRAEPSVLGVTLVGDVFREDGWNVEVAFPRRMSELTAAVRAEPCAGLVLLLGDVFPHPDQLDGVAADIRAARAASDDPAFIVLVGGRVALDRPDTVAAIVGADGAFTTAADALEKAKDLIGRGAADSGPAALSVHPETRGEPPTLPEQVPAGWFWVR